MSESTLSVTPGSGALLHVNSRTVGVNTVLEQVILHGEPMLATYTASASGISTATGASHLIQIMAGSSLPVYISRIRIMQFAVATTAAIARIHCVRLSSAGTGGTSVTPRPHDTTDAASGATAMTLPTVKGTETTDLFLDAAQFIQTVGTGGAGRNPVLLDWDFDRLKTKMIRIAAGTANGICLKMVDAVAGASVQINVELVEASF